MPKLMRGVVLVARVIVALTDWRVSPEQSLLVQHGRIAVVRCLNTPRFTYHDLTVFQARASAGAMGEQLVQLLVYMSRADLPCSGLRSPPGMVLLRFHFLKPRDQEPMIPPKI